MFNICIYNINNMIPLLCTKVKFHIKYLFGTRLSFLLFVTLKGSCDLYFELMKVLKHIAVLFASLASRRFPQLPISLQLHAPG